jgi:prolyl-tRNA synthetase
MKDLYTFDYSTSLALATYEQVRKAYGALFNELRIPYLVAEADSGDMGGNLSHEFHFLTSKGEDRVINCQSCDYVANEELAKTGVSTIRESRKGIQWTFVQLQQRTFSRNSSVNREFSVWRGLTRDRKTLVNVWYALSHDVPPGASTTHARPEINIHAVKRIVPDLDPSVENAIALWTPTTQFDPELPEGQSPVVPRVLNLIDYRLPNTILEDLNSGESRPPLWPESVELKVTDTTSFIFSKDPSSNEPLDLLRIQKGDICPKCGDDQLDVNVAIELGHTFFLGTRYSEPFEATVTLPSGQQALMQMGCHGIGVSRMIGAVAEMLADEKGLNWPRVIAPYEVVVVPTQGCEPDAIFIYDTLISESQNLDIANQSALDVVLDDRLNPFAWKMKDADLIGYPVIVVVGKSWKIERTCEVQCRRLGVRENVPFARLSAFVQDLLVRL